MTGILHFPICAGGQPQNQCRIGFSTSMFGDVNENDAVAAVRVWAQVIATERGILADPQAMIFRNVSEISDALEKGTVDCINMTTPEYFLIRGQVAGESIVAGVVSESIMEEYLLIVHRESEIERLVDLRGCTLSMLQSSFASLAPAWLDPILARETLGNAAVFSKRVIPVYNVGKAVLPVFFRQTDACVATRKGYETMVELNPQTGLQLKVIAASPPVVPAFFCFRRDYNSPVRNQIMEEIRRWHLSPAGRQILTIFQTARLEEHPVGCLDSALELLSRQQRLSGEPEPGVAAKESRENVGASK